MCELAAAQLVTDLTWKLFYSLHSALCQNRTIRACRHIITEQLHAANLHHVVEAKSVPTLFAFDGIQLLFCWFCFLDIYIYFFF